MFKDLSGTLEGLTNGDHRAFEQLFLSYEGKVLTYCLKILKSKEEAEDVVQQVFVSIWEKRKDIENVKDFDAYLFTMTRNIVYNKLRKRVYDFAFQNYYKDMIDHMLNATELEVEFEETKRIITEAIGKLPPKRKEIFVLSRYGGKSNKEIAEEIKVSVSFVENQINKALKTLKNYLKIY